MKGWKKWNAEWSLRAKSDVKAVHQLVKSIKNCIQNFAHSQGTSGNTGTEMPEKG